MATNDPITLAVLAERLGNLLRTVEEGERRQGARDRKNDERWEQHELHHREHDEHHAQVLKALTDHLTLDAGIHADLKAKGERNAGLAGLVGVVSAIAAAITGQLPAGKP